MDFGMWNRNYRLDQMGLKELWGAFFMHYTVQVYVVLALISGYLAFSSMIAIIPMVLSVISAIILYPLSWYVLHRFVLHGSFLYKSPLTAKTWKRIHFDHHRDPHDLNVLFGALHTTLPTIAVVTMPIGYLIGGWPAMNMAFCAGLLITCFYEFLHCVQHLNYHPKLKFLHKIKMLHLRHHFHDERSNYGITNFIPDRLFGTYAPKVQGRKRSETVFNLGYTKEEVKRFPWVARLTPDIDEVQATEEGIDRREPIKERREKAA